MTSPPTLGKQAAAGEDRHRDRHRLHERDRRARCPPSQAAPPPADRSPRGSPPQPDAGRASSSAAVTTRLSSEPRALDRRGRIERRPPAIRDREQHGCAAAGDDCDPPRRVTRCIKRGRREDQRQRERCTADGRRAREHSQPPSASDARQRRRQRGIRQRAPRCHLRRSRSPNGDVASTLRRPGAGATTPHNHRRSPSSLSGASSGGDPGCRDHDASCSGVSITGSNQSGRGDTARSASRTASAAADGGAGTGIRIIARAGPARSMAAASAPSHTIRDAALEV